MTQLEYAREEKVTAAMEKCAASEGVAGEVIRRGLAEGTIVITQNSKHSSIPPLGIGRGLRTKINANVGTSKDHSNL